MFDMKATNMFGASKKEKSRRFLANCPGVWKSKEQLYACLRPQHELDNCTWFCFGKVINTDVKPGVDQ